MVTESWVSCLYCNYFNSFHVILHHVFLFRLHRLGPRSTSHWISSGVQSFRSKIHLIPRESYLFLLELTYLYCILPNKTTSGSINSYAIYKESKFLLLFKGISYIDRNQSYTLTVNVGSTRYAEVVLYTFNFYFYFLLTANYRRLYIVVVANLLVVIIHPHTYTS